MVAMFVTKKKIYWHFINMIMGKIIQCISIYGSRVKVRAILNHWDSFEEQEMRKRMTEKPWEEMDTNIRKCWCKIKTFTKCVIILTLNPEGLDRHKLSRFLNWSQQHTLCHLDEKLQLWQPVCLLGYWYKWTVLLICHPIKQKWEYM